MKGIIGFVYVCLIVVALYGCSRQKPVSFDTMTKLVWELALVDEFSGYYVRIDTLRNLDSATNTLYYRVLNMHGVSREEFNKMIRYYDEHPAEYQELIDSVNSYGTRERESSFEKRYNTNPQRELSDSLLH